MENWTGHQQQLVHLAARQLFFVGGPPRSGTTWLQYLLDSHPEVSCRGEALFGKHLAAPLEAMMAQRREALAAKNRAVFRELTGYPLPPPEDAEFLFGTAVLLALERQSADKPCRAVGEKTPENVFLFARLKRLFPAAKLIAIVRDPRDLLTSAWHFFRKPSPGEDDEAAKTRFIAATLPSLDHGARTVLALLEAFPTDCRIVTYERLHAAAAPVAAELFRFLGVSDDAAVVADCVARTSFAAMSGGRSSGEARNGSFFRSGMVGDWQSTFTPAMNAMILRELGWMYPRFGWLP
jgi:hypothetical protein